jgi:hypothetical protein
MGSAPAAATASFVSATARVRRPRWSPPPRQADAALPVDRRVHVRSTERARLCRRAGLGGVAAAVDSDGLAVLQRRRRDRPADLHRVGARGYRRRSLDRPRPKALAAAVAEGCAALRHRRDRERLDRAARVRILSGAAELAHKGPLSAASDFRLGSSPGIGLDGLSGSSATFT